MSSVDQRFVVEPVGHVVGGRRVVEDDAWGEVEARIRLDHPQAAAEMVRGLEDFSHLEVVFLFDRVDPDAVEWGSRHPRGNPDWPRMGILAQRAKDRPNRIGVSRCELVKVEDVDLVVRGLDAVDGTPVLDVKPWMDGFAPRTSVREPAWAVELMRGYW
ncbi:MAG: SAM-dependent methyltransferase [Actinomycetes bacterium]